MNSAKDMNSIRLQMIDIAKLTGQKYPFMEVKIQCPWCGKKTLLLKECNTHYWCMNKDCGREGDLDELEQFLYKDMMEKPRGVKL